MKDFLLSVPALVAGRVNPKERYVVVPEPIFRELVEIANEVRLAKKKKTRK